MDMLASYFANLVVVPLHFPESPFSEFLSIVCGGKCAHELEYKGQHLLPSESISV